jgi:hypothetical protein
MGFFFLGILFIHCYFFSRGLPECHHLVVLTVIIVPNLKGQREQPAFHPARRTTPFRYLAPATTVPWIYEISVILYR